MSWEMRLGRVIAKRTRETIEIMEMSETDPFRDAWQSLAKAFDIEGDKIKPSKEFFEFAAKSYDENENISFTEVFAEYFKEDIKDRALEKMLDDSD